MIYRAIKIIVANIVRILVMPSDYIYNTQNYLEKTQKHNRKKKGTHNLANIIDIQSCPLSILATDPNIHRYTQHETLVNKVRK